LADAVRHRLSVLGSEPRLDDARDPGGRCRRAPGDRARECAETGAAGDRQITRIGVARPDHLARTGSGLGRRALSSQSLRLYLPDRATCIRRQVRTHVASRPAALRALLESNMSILMEAHNGMSAKSVAEAGFAGIWASGFTMASALGLRDANEASWTQVLHNVELMADAVDV